MMKIVNIFLLNVSIFVIHCKNASEWRSRSVYQMLTDRFSPRNFSYNRCMERPMSENATRNYCGGTYRGAIDQLDYIVQLGFNALWISPITSQVDQETVYGVGWHGYWQKNIYQLNENFGSENDLIDLIAEAHKRDIWIMLDVVPNHLGPNLTGSYLPFNKSEHFHQPQCFIQDWTNQTQVELCSFGNENFSLPDLNTENEFVISTLISWLNETIRKYQIDGIRIDAFRHIRQSFWIDYINAGGVYSIGEVASSNTSFVSSYQHFADGLFHFPLSDVLNLVFRDDNQTRQSMFNLENQVEQNQKLFKDPTLCGVFLDNHDLDRFLNHTQNLIRIQNAFVYLMFSDGIPFLYIGTEQNFTGNPNEKYGARDPWNREPLWRSFYNTSSWTFNYLSKLNQIRSLIKQKYQDQYFISYQETISIDNDTYVYKKHSIRIVVSNQPFYKLKSISLPSTTNIKQFKDLLSDQIISIDQNNSFIINNWLPMILIPNSSSSSFYSSSYFILFDLFIFIYH